MDSWPANDRNDHTTTTGRKAKPKRKVKDMFPNYPDIVQGSLNAATLTQGGGVLQWLSAVKSSDGSLSTRLRIEKPITMFPTTRPPILHIPQTTVLQHAEQGANFLRTFLPDVDIPAELIRDEIAQDAKIQRDLTHFDPYLGNLLEPVVTHDSPSETTVLLAFPTGELNRELNVSPLLYSETEGTLFKPSAHPIHRYDTPIQQITSSKPRAGIFQNSYIAVRTFGLTSLLKSTAPVSTNQHPQMIEMTAVQHADVGKRAIVDFKLSSSPIEALAVNDCGGLYRFTFDNGMKTPYLVHAAAVVDEQDSFWRIALGGNDTSCLLMSAKALNHRDFRADGLLNLFSISTPQDMLTSVEDDDGSNVIRFCSTREILWIDKRFPGKPLLGYRHGRNWDRTLGTQTLDTSHALTLLTSRINSLVTVYDITRSTESLLHLTGPPYYLWPENVISGSHYGQAFFRHPSGSCNEDFSMFQLSDRGSINQLGLRGSPQSDNRFNTFWSNEMKKLAQQASSLRLDYGPLGSRDSSETDLVPPYNFMFRAHVEKKRQAEEESVDAFYNLLDQIPTFWRDSDAPVEQMLTTYDVFFRTGAEPTEASRADFLTEGIINSTRGYRALTQDRLSAQHLKKDAAWHYNITPVLKKLEPGFSRDAQEWNESFQRYNLGEDPDRPIPSVRREKEAREQLVLDLMLSADVFSAQTFSSSSEGNLELENMTKTLSLAGEPPDVDFGYLRPLPKNATDHYTKTENDEVTISIGTRMLVKEWELGVDPEEHAFRDRYDGTADPQAIQRTKSVKPLGQIAAPEPPQIIPNTQSQRPPLLMATTILPLHKPEAPMRSILKAQASLVLPHLGSQVAVSGSLAASQEYMISTQVLPGPYGGRPSMGKKKATKKRLGGF